MLFLSEAYSVMELLESIFGSEQLQGVIAAINVGALGFLGTTLGVVYYKASKVRAALGLQQKDNETKEKEIQEIKTMIAGVLEIQAMGYLEAKNISPEVKKKTINIASKCKETANISFDKILEDSIESILTHAKPIISEENRQAIKEKKEKVTGFVNTVQDKGQRLADLIKTDEEE